MRHAAELLAGATPGRGQAAPLDKATEEAEDELYGGAVCASHLRLLAVRLLALVLLPGLPQELAPTPPAFAAAQAAHHHAR
jgi:hypothetical protein